MGPFELMCYACELQMFWNQKQKVAQVTWRLAGQIVPVRSQGRPTQPGRLGLAANFSA